MSDDSEDPHKALHVYGGDGGEIDAAIAAYLNSIRLDDLLESHGAWPRSLPSVDVGGQVERLRAFAAGCRGSMWQSRDETIRLCDEAASLIQSQAARIAELEAEVARKFEPPIRFVDGRPRRLLNGERKG